MINYAHNNNLNYDKSELFKISDYDKKYKTTVSKYCPQLGDIMLKSNIINNNKKIILKQTVKFSEEELKNEIYYIKFLLSLNHNNLINLIDYSSYVHKSLCNSSYDINYYYEYFGLSLKDVLVEKQKYKDSFSDEDLLHVIYQMCFAGYYLEGKEIYHGDIRPESIFLDSDNGNCKLLIANSYGIINNGLSLQRLNYSLNNHLYVSPVVFQNILNNNKDYNKSKEDVFSLGLVILELGLLKPIQNIYNYKQRKFDYKVLTELITEFEEIFLTESNNMLLVSTVKNMLSVDENERPNFGTLISKLPDYNEIINYYYNKF